VRGRRKRTPFSRRSIEPLTECLARHAGHPRAVKEALALQVAKARALFFSEERTGRVDGRPTRTGGESDLLERASRAAAERTSVFVRTHWPSRVGAGPETSRCSAREGSASGAYVASPKGSAFRTDVRATRRCAVRGERGTPRRNGMEPRLDSAGPRATPSSEGAARAARRHASPRKGNRAGKRAAGRNVAPRADE
jgi:hypothetical protein